jgi:hypothetical protein
VSRESPGRTGRGTAVGSRREERAIIYQPTTDAVDSHDASLYYHQGLHYLFILYTSTRHSGPGCDGIALATSEDGVHFDEVGPIISKSARTDALGGISRPWRAGGKFVMGFSERREGVQSIFFAESDDLRDWRRLGDERRFAPDPRWYDDTPVGRWDDLWVLPREEGLGFQGYLTARPWNQAQGVAFESFAMAESENGIDWHALAPAKIDWGDWPQMSIGEVAGVEKIGNRYYLIQHYAEHMLGNRQVRQHLGRDEGMYLFVADRSEGPFRPDVGGYRWPPTYNVFTRFHAAPGETLVNHKSVAICGKGRALWLSPLKKAVVDADGHLRLRYWRGNDAARGRPIAVDLTVCSILGVPRYRHAPDPDWSLSAGRLEANEPNGGGVALLPHQFDLERGLILEGTMEVREPPNRWSGIGVFIEENARDNTGTGIVLQTRNRAELGPFRAGGSTKVLPYPTFKPVDIVDVTVAPDRRCHFRLLIRRGLVEFYYDELLVQCYSLPREPSGRVGLVVESGHAVFDALEAWEMDL